MAVGTALTAINVHFPPGGALPVKRYRSNTGSSFRTAASSASLFTPRLARHLVHQAMLSFFVQPRSASRFVGRPAAGIAEGMVVRGHIVTLGASTNPAKNSLSKDVGNPVKQPSRNSRPVPYRFGTRPQKLILHGTTCGTTSGKWSGKWSGARAHNPAVVATPAGPNNPATNSHHNHVGRK